MSTISAEKTDGHRPVQLLLVLFLQAEDDLDRASTLRDFTTVRDDHVGSVPKRCQLVPQKFISVGRHSLEDVRSHVLAAD